MQDTSTVKLPTTLLTIQTEELVLRVIKSRNTDENAFNGDLFEIEHNHERNKDENTWF